MADDKVILCQSGVNKKGEPFVHLFINDELVAQMTPGETRHHALAALGAAEAAEQDAFMVDYVKKHIGADDRAAAGIIVDFRQWRENYNKIRDGQNRRVG